MNCGSCHQQMNADARFCSNCGQPMAAQQQGWNFYNAYSGRLVRPREGRQFAGVCVGFANHFGWDPVLVRLLTVVLFFLGCGSILIAYIAAWIIIPNAPLYYVPMPPAGYPPASYPGGPAGSTVGSAPIS